MKSYIMYRKDLANKAAVAAAVTFNPKAFSIGSIIIPVDGTFHYVSALGTIVTLEPAASPP